jgi:two-component system chemotaxis sensor kinase CheA
MSDASPLAGSLSDDDMADYLRMYIDETGEQLDALVETLLALEAEPGEARGLNEAFRLIHSIKGSSALLGLDRITTLTHHLESHFERLRTGRRVLDGPTMNVVLRCIDFLRACNEHLRHGRPLGSAGDLLEEVKSLETVAATEDVPTPARAVAPPASAAPPAATPAPSPSLPAAAAVGAIGPGAVPAVAAAVARLRHWRITVTLRPSLPLVEMKVELILTRLAAAGDLVDLQPPRSMLADLTELSLVEAILRSGAEREALVHAARVEGVDGIEVVEVGPDARATVATSPVPPTMADPDDAGADEPAAPAADAPEVVAAVADSGARGGAPLAETVRVDVDRLDILLNLVGELVINRARLTQLAGELAPTFKKSGLSGRLAGTVEALHDLLRQPEDERLAAHDRAGPRGPAVGLVAEQLAQLEQQTRLWDESRLAFDELTAAIDQLTRVSNSLQRGVLNTRMIPVGPLFNRFKRSVRDIARELGKRVRLELVGEKTELDKRMIDEIGDPLNHLVRNCIDHGIEPADVRLGHGKPEIATVRLAASHRGNNVFIVVEDDGGGIDTARVRQIAVARGVVAADVAETLGDRELIELIFQPGFSTAAKVSGISGRGVGMDIVRTRIEALNGTVEVDSVRGRGTRFTIRLPLTLTITRCMLFRLPQGVLAVPIEHVREITSLARHPSMSVEGRQVCDVRGEFLPVVGIEEIFTWPVAQGRAAGGGLPNIAILHANNRVLGLRVDALLGGQDIVVKPLDENFVHIRGLGGASVLGDGTVCMLLDVAACLDLVRRGQEPLSTVTHVT